MDPEWRATSFSYHAGAKGLLHNPHLFRRRGFSYCALTP